MAEWSENDTAALLGRVDMSDVVLGRVPPANSERDAIHVAVIPMRASETLRAGQRVGVIGDQLAGPSSKPTGIVDPFLTGVIAKDSWFWMALLPGTVTGMRHEWQHPAFPVPRPPAIEDMDAERLFAESVAAQCGKTLAALMEDAERYVEYGEYEYDNSERYKQVEDWERFWRYFTKVTGKESSTSWAPYTCSC